MNNDKAIALPGDVFFDDFNDGIWIKHPGNPILTRTEDWEARCICEPSVIFEDGIFKMWYMGMRSSVGYNAALGFATSKDGVVWEKHPANPILKDPEEAIIHPTVLKHAGVYYLFASDYQNTNAAGVINRWTSRDGINWENKTTVLKPTEPWEGRFHNTGIIVEPDGKWQMIINTEGPLGYAYSHDGLHWTKWRDPVLKGFSGGDPCLRKIGDKYYIWYSRADHKSGHLRIYCAWSEDMIHWHELNYPQIGYTEPWERGIERPEVNWDRHLTDADLLEHAARVFMYYQGAQCPLGLAVFNGTFSQLAERLAKPPLSKWAESPYGCVEHNELKISDNESNTEPLYEKTATFGDQAGYMIEFRARSYAGYRFQSAIPAPEKWATKTKCYPETSRQVQAVMRHVDPNNFARFWLKDADTTCYQECIGGVLGAGVNIGANGVNDDRWHDWKIVVDGDENRLYIDGKYIGAHRSSPIFTQRTDMRIGFSVYNTYASFDDVRARKGSFPDPAAGIGPE